MDAFRIANRAERHLLRIDPTRPRIDRDAAERALGGYLEALGLERRAVRWLPNIRELRRERVWPTARRGRWQMLFARQSALFGNARNLWIADDEPDDLDDEVEDFADDVDDEVDGEVTAVWRWWRAPEEPLTRVHALAAADAAALVAGLGVSRDVRGVRRVVPELEECIAIVRGLDTFRPARLAAIAPLAEAAANGLFCFAVGSGGELVCLERPVMRLDEEHRLHDWDGHPAAGWPDDTGLWFWRGVHMTEGSGRRPDRVTPRRIVSWWNAERRRVAIERIGLEAFVRGIDAEVVQQDDYGRLWRADVSFDGEDFVAVEVVNSTAEPDGTHRRYFLRVPPDVRTAREAVAWTFGLHASDYDPVAMT